MRQRGMTQRDMIIALYTEVLGIENGGGLKRQIEQLEGKLDHYIATREETCPLLRREKQQGERKQRARLFGVEVWKIAVAMLALGPPYITSFILLAKWLGGGQ